MFKLSKRNHVIIWLVAALTLSVAGCKKHAPPITTAPPVSPPAAPAGPPEAARPPVVAQFTAEPSSIERGQSATLRWSVSDATSVTIEPGLGPVQSNGSRQVFPSNTTTYTLTAMGAR